MHNTPPKRTSGRKAEEGSRPKSAVVRPSRELVDDGSPRRPYALIGSTTTGSLALCVEGAAVVDDVKQEAAVPATTLPPATKANWNVPRPQSARVQRPQFSFQRTFDGGITLEHRVTRDSRGSERHHFHATGGAIPVVGRR